MSNKTTLIIGLSVALLIGCNAEKDYKATTYDFPKPVDTKDHQIARQEYRTYGDPTDGVFASNEYTCARLNGFDKINDTLYRATISPENAPINHSAYYSFKVWSDTTKQVTVELNYTYAKHRYHPKLSTDGLEWSKLPSQAITYPGDSTIVHVNLSISPDTLWLSAQEIIDTKMVKAWSKDIANSEDRVHLSVIGKSPEGREMLFMDIYEDGVEGKETIVLLSRQHPPEVTGFMAFQSFVSGLLDNPNSSQFFKKYRVMLYPLLNPDGVDNGHWRHNTGGIDLNRDWAYYHQPETRLVANHIVKQTKTNNNEVILGLDFHSTYHDVYYTLDQAEITTNIPNFKNQWFKNIEKSLSKEGYLVNEKTSGLGNPITKGWFYTQFGAEGITYEIGDETPRDFIKKKGKVSASSMISVLLEGKYR